MSYQIIETNRVAGRVDTLCRALGVSVSGYYAWRRRTPSQRARQDALLLEHIRTVYQAGRGVYGSPRVHAGVCQRGIPCSRKRVARLMRQAGLRSRRRPKRHIRTTDSQHSRPVAPNLLQRDFDPHAPNEKWVGDIVGIWTDEGWLYLAALLDTYSRMIVGWAMSSNRDEALVTDALRMALVRRGITPDHVLIHHTDRGSQYTADDYLALLASHGIQVSMSGKGDPYDNAMMESFFSTLRAELTDLERFLTRDAARLAVFEFIEVFYNRQRFHSSLGYRSPGVFEAAPFS
jgi:transposase InsO family protein